MEHDPVCGMEIIPQSGTKAEKRITKGRLTISAAHPAKISLYRRQ